MNGVHSLGGESGEPESPGPSEWWPPLPCGPLLSCGNVNSGLQSFQFFRRSWKSAS